MLHQIKTFNSRIEHFRERLKRAREQHRDKLQVAEQEQADAQRQWAAVEAERSASSRQLDENESVLRELKERLHRGRIEHEEEVANVRQQQHQLAIQVRAYHQDLLNTMKAVTASQTLLCAA